MMRKLALILALAALLLPGLSLAETTQAPQTPNLTLEEILLDDPCPTEASSPWVPPGGCSRPCKKDLDCPGYPDEICLKGCCVV